MELYMKIISKTLDKIFAIHDNRPFIFYLDKLYYCLNKKDYIGFYLDDLNKSQQVLRGSLYSILIENKLYGIED